METGSVQILRREIRLDQGMTVGLGLLGTVLGLMFALAPWSSVVLVGVAIAVLTATESEGFLLAMVFLIPMGWIASISFPLVGDAARLDIPTTARLIVIGAFFVARMLRDRRSFSQVLSVPLTRLSLLLALVAIASLVFGSGLSYESLKAIVRLSSYIGFYLVLALWIDSRVRILKVSVILMASTICVAAFGIFQEIWGDYTSLWLFLNPPTEWFVPMDYRAPSFFANCNFFAGYLNLVLPLSLGFWLLGEGRLRKLGAWSTALGVLALLCTQSLGGIVAFCGIVALSILCFGGTLKRKAALLCALCLLAAGFYLGKAVLNPAHEGQGFSYDQAIRLVLWGIAWDFFRQSPLFGVGWGNFNALYGSYVTGISWIPAGQFDVHNIYLQLLSETGLVGFGTFFWLVFRAVRQAQSQLRRSAAMLDRVIAFGVLGAILSVLLHGIVDFFFQVSPQFGTVFWLLLALLVATGRGLAKDLGGAGLLHGS